MITARLAVRNYALNPLSFARAMRNDDVKTLDLFAVGEAHLQFKPIVVGGIRWPIKRDHGEKFCRQALFDIGRFECRATHAKCRVADKVLKLDPRNKRSRRWLAVLRSHR